MRQKMHCMEVTIEKPKYQIQLLSFLKTEVFLICDDHYFDLQIFKIQLPHMWSV
jgi:hypothetical protein